MKNLLFVLMTVFFVDVSAQQQYGYFNYEKVENVLSLKKDVAIWLNDYKRFLEDSATVYVNAVEKVFKNTPHYMDAEIKKEWELRISKVQTDYFNYETRARTKYLNYELFLNKELKQATRSFIIQYCRLYKISFLANTDAVIYCEACKDHTEELMNYICGQEMKE